MEIVNYIATHYELFRLGAGILLGIATGFGLEYCILKIKEKLKNEESENKSNWVKI